MRTVPFVETVLGFYLYAAVAQAAPSARQPAPDFAPVRQYIREAMVKAHVPSIAVAVSWHGRIVWEEAFGYADVERRIPATPHTRYGLASVTKILTATSVMILAERGKLDIDHPVNEYLRNARLSSPKWNVDEATIRRVATHTGGLATYDSVCYDDEPDCDRSEGDMINRYGVVFWRPGDHFDYSNLGYGVLDRVVSDVASESYPDFLQANIFVPLGMRECAMDETAGVATHYGVDHKPVPAHEEIAQGASSVACSADSLIRFGMFALKQHASGQRAILKESTIDAMRNQTVSADNGQRYGIGWWVDDHQHGVQNIFDQGGTNDTAALLDTIPSADIALVVLSNTGNQVMGGIADRILAAMLPSYAADLAKASATTLAAEPREAPSVANFAGTWSGVIKTYAGDVPVKFVVAADGTSQAAIGAQSLAPARKARLHDSGVVFGAFGDIGTLDADRRKPYRLGFELYPDDQSLYGVVTTWQQPGARDAGLFSYWVWLARSEIGESNRGRKQ